MPSKRAIRPGDDEANFQRRVTDLASLLGWHWQHAHDSRHSAAGLPDLICVKPPRLVYLELKGYEVSGRPGQPTAEQSEWLDLLRACPGVEAWCVWPEDLELVAQILQGTTRS